MTLIKQQQQQQQRRRRRRRKIMPLPLLCTCVDDTLVAYIYFHPY